MVNPVSGQQQIPAANTFQPGGNDATKRTEDNKSDTSNRSSGSDAASSEASAARSNARAEETRRKDEQAANDSYQKDSGTVRASSSRGTEVDISA